jgi:hypothetical protein
MFMEAILNAEEAMVRVRETTVPLPYALSKSSIRPSYYACFVRQSTEALRHRALESRRMC